MLAVVIVHGPHNSRPVGCLPPLEACTVPSDTMKSTPQEGGSQFSSISRASGPCTELNGVFSNKNIRKICYKYAIC